MSKPLLSLLPVRLNCRYSNGIVKTFLARAVSYEGGVLHVLTTEKFEVGISLRVLSPLLSGPTAFRVAGLTKSEDQRGSFLMEMHALTPLESSAVSKPPVTAAIPQVFRAAAAELADRLELIGAEGTLREALEGMSPTHARICVWAAVGAVLVLAERNGFADPLPLLRSLRGT